MFRRVVVASKALLRLEALSAKGCRVSNLRAGARRDIAEGGGGGTSKRVENEAQYDGIWQ